MKNKEYVIKTLIEKTKRPEAECIVINSILENHFIIGHNNKEKIKEDFINILNVDEEEANKLYNICAEILVKGIFKKHKEN